MKTAGRYFAIATLVAAAAPAAGQPARCAQISAEFAAPRPSDLVWPDFCSIPPAPTDVRPATAFKDAVVRTRLAGADLVRESGPDTFSLSGTNAFLDEARREAAPPAPLTTPSGPDTAAFVAEAKARAKPPPRHSRPHG
ncbi:MAG TPA: hypothetical protein VIC25_08630 [Caulobacteraceae bacterium]|jgi:hypothetical protein